MVDGSRLALKSGAPIFLSGMGAMLMQVVCLRQFLVIFAGNELVLGIVFALWLTAVACGSLVGHRFRSPAAFAAVLLAGGAISQLTVLLVGAVRPLLGIGTGETVSLTATLGVAALCLFPLCFAIGMIFPLAVITSGTTPSRVYGLEAAGAFLGGLLFISFLSGSAGPAPIAAMASVLFSAAGAIVLDRRRYLLLLGIPALLYALTVGLETSRAQQSGDLVNRTESRYGEITVFLLGEQLNFFESGKFLFSYPDPQTDELRVHLPVSVHPGPKSILLLGSSPGTLASLAAYPGVQIDYVEMDPALIKVSLGLLSPADLGTVTGRNVRIIAEDVRRFIKNTASGYDLIIMNLPDPSTAAVNRMYTVDFFREARSVLKPGGILSLNLPTSSGYIGRRMRTANGSIYNSLSAVFSDVALSSEEYGYLLASDRLMDTDPDTLAARFARRGVITRQFRPSIFMDAFDPLKVGMVRDRLSSVHVLNTDARPVAYLYNLMLWADVHGRFMNRLLGATSAQMMTGFAMAAMALGIIFALRRRAVYFAAFTIGYTAMTFSIVLLLSYQAAFGHVYETVGLLSAIFMAGMAVGSLAAGAISLPLQRLRMMEGIAASFFAAVPFFLKTDASFFMAAAVCGSVAGMGYSASSSCISGMGTAGRLYATDLAGSVAGALLSALLLVPMAGIDNTIFSLSGMKALSLLLLVTVKDETH